MIHNAIVRCLVSGHVINVCCVWGAKDKKSNPTQKNTENTVCSTFCTVSAAARTPHWPGSGHVLKDHLAVEMWKGQREFFHFFCCSSVHQTHRTAGTSGRWNQPASLFISAGKWKTLFSPFLIAARANSLARLAWWSRRSSRVQKTSSTEKKKQQAIPQQQPARNTRDYMSFFLHFVARFLVVAFRGVLFSRSLRFLLDGWWWVPHFIQPRVCVFWR